MAEGFLQGKIIIVTGAAGGIGEASAQVLARHGAHLVLTDIIGIGVEQAERICAAGGEARFIAADVGNEESVAALVAKTIEIYGRIDGAFNNAGVEQSGQLLADLSTEQWDRAIRIDLTGVFLCMKHQIRAMLQTGGGAIVNTASALGAVALVRASDYVAAKHGVIGLTKAAAADYSAQGIRVNAILPGVVRTPMIERLWNDPAHAAAFEQLKLHHPIGRFGEPAEIGETAAWLLSDAASFVTGASISVDGGYLTI
ncbi:SDR family oxidoreductase [Sphingosinicella sp. LHD-64]|uniref:SDR family NAD(P)-dependent oxidoreductase n=1 Tax=Sphingosinicella sp. LHD-64 TaxID=3072139 RepID=UPI00280EEF0A|nr:SDR family oxidoreductase [Sphingosinicella sp. LHD-64]MDQ8757436.1 SDR family oxidoreductase [Sphingosinicella sp. LHD-64]